MHVECAASKKAYFVSLPARFGEMEGWANRRETEAEVHKERASFVDFEFEDLLLGSGADVWIDAGGLPG